MGDVLKWFVLAVLALLAWRYWRSGVNANLSLGPGWGGNSGASTGYTFMGPGMVFGFNPSTFGGAGKFGSVADF